VLAHKNPPASRHARELARTIEVDKSEGSEWKTFHLREEQLAIERFIEVNGVRGDAEVEIGRS